MKIFPFKRLPREIRDQIYDYVFGPGEVNMTATAAYHTLNRRPTSTGPNFASLQDPPVRLALLSVDREIFHESIQSFYSRRKFSIGLRVGDEVANQALDGIGKHRLDLIRTIRYSVTMFSHASLASEKLWRETFRHLRSASGLQTLKIDLGTTFTTNGGLTPSEWVELDLCLVDIKGRVNLLVHNTCCVFVRQHPVECEGITTKLARKSNSWTCKKGETEWSTMKSVYRAES